MASEHCFWRMGMWGRGVALALLTLALAGGLALWTPPPASAAPAPATICGSAKPGCAPQTCHVLNAWELNLPAFAPFGGARASLSRARGFSSSTVSISGSGWPAGATVDVYMAAYDGSEMSENPHPVAVGTAGATGDLAISPFSTPQQAQCSNLDSGTGPTLNQVLFVLQAAGQARVSLVYGVYPTPSFQSLASPEITAGSSVTLTGSGWDPNEAITITPAIQPWPVDGDLNTDVSAFSPLPSDAVTLTAASNGSFTHTVPAPVEPPETLITFIASSSDALDGPITVSLNGYLAVLPKRPPSLALSASSGVAGSTVRLSGSGWPANQVIQINECPGPDPAHCDSASIQRLDTARADSAGRLDVTVHIPASATPGPLTLQAIPATTPFGADIYARALPFSVVLPWDQAHPRLALALRASPFAALVLIFALIALADWLPGRRRAGQTVQ